MTTSRIMKRLTAAVLSVACVLFCFSAVTLTVSAAYENTHVNTGNQALDLVSVARTQLGYAEGANNYNKYAESFGNANAPWCGYFISWCARQAGIPTTVIPTSGSSSSYFTIGTYHARNSGYIPQMGDIMLYGSYGDSYHVSIVEYYDSATGKVHVLDGNWSDKVSSHSTTLANTEVAGFCTPYYTSSLSELTAYGMKTPTMLVAGKSFSISGLLGSPNLITKVTVSITDEKGKDVVTASGVPNAKGFNINALDSQIPFGKLTVGNYVFTVTATDTKQTKRWAYPFQVVSTVKMIIDNVSVPETLTVGSTFKIAGIITCPEPMTVVSVSVYDKNNVYKTGGTVSPNAASYNISGVDNYVAFSKLAVGSYTLTVTAKSAGGSAKWEYPFTVTPKYTLTDHVRPTTVVKGQDFDIAGTVSCSETLTSAKVMVLDEKSGETIFEAFTDPKADTFDISAFNEQLPFDTLEAGTYKYRVWVHSKNGSKSWPYLFTVAAPDATFTLTDRTYPTTLTCGDDFDVKGVVTCSEPLTKVQVMVLTLSGGETVLEAVAEPHTTTFDVSTLDSQLAFDSLPAGSYKYRVWAHSAGASKSWPYAFTVEGATFTLDDASYPQTMNIGGDHTVAGTLSSSEVLTDVTISVITELGTPLISASVSPNATIFDLSELDAKLNFSSLPAANLTYVIQATTNRGSRTWRHSFSVTKPTVMINLSGETYPTTLTVGKSFSLKGSLSSQTPMTKVSLTVKNQSGIAVVSASASPNATTYSIASLDNSMTFGKLTAGDYVYVIEAFCEAGSKTWEYPFTVVSASDVEIALSDAVTPSALKVGASFSVSGTVTASETLTYVSISAVDKNGTTVIQSENTAPNATTFRISTLDASFRFGALTEGRYTYVITAKAGGHTKTWEYPFTVGNVSEDTTLAGDITLDGNLNAMDSLLLYRFVSGQIELTDEQLAAVGISPINMTTTLKLYNFISGVSSSYP